MSVDAGCFSTSQLGTLDYWEHVYDGELLNFEELGEEGEVWFGETCLAKVLRRVASLRGGADLDAVSVLDVGSGNGWTLIELQREHGFRGALIGTDYSPKAVLFARRLAAAKLGDDSACLFTADDILNSRLLARAGGADAGDADEAERRVSARLVEVGGAFDFVLDKGTYDAISLRDDGPAARETYRATVATLLKADGYLVITSCNWTRAELVEQFSALFDLHSHIDYPTIRFAGATGSTYATAVFRHKRPATN